ncbi:MAG: single-stranded-DNA-specific exonuclease RecJ [Deltaproteobacteria bacterium]|nr:single-stranded-DNA-specific exonuclease RecJ [Deltaproteobacteria bacterium]
MTDDVVPAAAAVAVDTLPPLPKPPLAWSEREADAVVVAAVAAAHKLPEAVARVLVGRGITSVADAGLYLRPTLKDLPDPLRLAGLDAALDRVCFALDKQETIGVFGDYDVDGVTSTTLLTDFLEALGARVTCTIPDRMIEGYGLSRAGVDRLIDAGCKLIITVDCGVTNHDEVLYAKERGADVIVVDHHTVPVELPKASAVINPHRKDCTSGSVMLCAVGVTFNLCMAIRRRLRERAYFSPTRPEPDLKDALDLVALGTVADVVPLVGENRVLVHAGLRLLRQGKRPGMRALLNVAGVDAAQMTASDLGFQLGPRVNAAGRLGDAMQGVRLLKSDGEEATKLAAILDGENAARRSIEKKIVEDAIRQVEQSVSLRNAKAIVVADESWHPGVVGIVASRLVDRFGRPAVVIGQGGRGSGRSIERFHLYDALRTIKDIIGPALAGFGGHAHAAGVRIAPGGLEGFRDAFLNHAESVLAPEDLRRVAFHDGVIGGDALTFGFVRALENAAPFGRKNPEPLFLLRGVRLRSPKEVGNGHLKGVIDPNSLLQATGSRAASLVEVISFGTADRVREWDGPLDLLGTPDLNEWQGRVTVQLRLKDFRPSEAS